MADKISEEFYKGIPFFEEIVKRISHGNEALSTLLFGPFAVAIGEEKYLIDSFNVKPDGKNYHHQVYYLNEKEELQVSNTAIDEDSNRVLSKIEQMLDEDKSITSIRITAKRKN